MSSRISLYDFSAFAVNLDAYRLLTDAQRARLATWSIQTGKPVVEIARECKLVVEKYNSEFRTYMLTGLLPHCGLYGGMTPDGCCHT